MAKRIPFGTTSNALAAIWGTPAEAGRRSASARKASQAGVTRDHRLTPIAQKLAAELAELKADADAKEAARDTRSSLEKKYDIHDGIAYVQPNAFYSSFSRMISELKLAGIKTIRIDNQMGLQAEFQILDVDDISDEEWDNTSKIQSQDIWRLGISGALGGANKAIVKSKARSIYGVLHSTFLSQELAAHAKDQTKGKKHSSNAYLAAGNFSEIFLNATSLKTWVTNLKKAEQINLTLLRTFKTGKPISVAIGQIITPKHALSAELDLSVHSFSSTRSLIKRVIGRYDPNEWTNEIFKGRQGILIFDRQPAYQVAVLLPPVLTLK